MGTNVCVHACTVHIHACISQFSLMKVSKREYTPVETVSTHRARIAVSPTPHRADEDCSETRLIRRPGQGQYKTSLEHVKP